MSGYELDAPRLFINRLNLKPQITWALRCSDGGARVVEGE